MRLTSILDAPQVSTFHCRHKFPRHKFPRFTAATSFHVSFPRSTAQRRRRRLERWGDTACQQLSESAASETFACFIIASHRSDSPSSEARARVRDYRGVAPGARDVSERVRRFVAENLTEAFLQNGSGSSETDMYLSLFQTLTRSGLCALTGHPPSLAEKQLTDGLINCRRSQADQVSQKTASPRSPVFWWQAMTYWSPTAKERRRRLRDAANREWLHLNSTHVTTRFCGADACGSSESKSDSIIQSCAVKRCARELFCRLSKTFCAAIFPGTDRHRFILLRAWICLVCRTPRPCSFAAGLSTDQRAETWGTAVPRARTRSCEC